MLIPANSAQSTLGVIGALMVLAIGLVASAGQLTMTWAFHHLDTSTGSLLGMMTVVFNVVIGTITFSELRGLASLLGMIVIVVSCAGIVYLNRPRVAAIEIEPLARVKT